MRESEKAVEFTAEVQEREHGGQIATRGSEDWWTQEQEEQKDQENLLQLWRAWAPASQMLEAEEGQEVLVMLRDWSLGKGMHCF